MSDGAGETEDSGAPASCPHCDRAFARERYRDLHLGLAHAERLTPAQRAAADAAREEERRELRLFRLKALGALVLLYFGFIVVYAFTL